MFDPEMFEQLEMNLTDDGEIVFVKPEAAKKEPEKQSEAQEGAAAKEQPASNNAPSQQQHDWEKRFRDTQSAFDKYRHESETKLAEMENKLRQLEASLSRKDASVEASDEGSLDEDDNEGVDLSDPRSAKRYIAEAVKRAVNDTMENGPLKPVTQEARLRAELQEAVSAYGDTFVKAAPLVQQVISKFPKLTFKEAYEQLAFTAGIIATLQQGKQQKADEKVTDAAASGEAADGKTGGEEQVKDLAEKARKLATEEGVAVNSGVRQAPRNIREAVLMTLEEM